MEPTVTAAPQQQQGRFARSSAAPPPAPVAAPPPAPVAASPPAPPADLASVRAIERRWPRTVPAKRVFPRS